MTDWYWHIHHEVICEPLTEPLENRLDFIRRHKPTAEVGTRLRLIAPVTVELPAALDKAGDALVKARAVWARSAYVKTQDAYVKAWGAYVKAFLASVKELERLHAIDCPAALAGTCPWDGTTIFPEASETNHD